MSAVYKAYDPNLKRVVAIKVIHSHLADDPRFLMRFEEEASAVAQLRHPNIVQVFDFNHDGDLYYMVQEFVAGETLQQRLRRLHRANRRMPLDEAIQVAQGIAAAAGYAHARGLIHRDIKPANIMLDIHNQAILMDFGIVKITGGDRHTATGAVVGTALYMAPEMIRGETPDARADQYSLGVTLFEMVCGKPPFEADSAMTLMMMHLNDPLPDLRSLRPDVPEALIAVVEKALEKDKNRRYPSMEAFSAALQEAASLLRPALGEQVTVIEAAPEPRDAPKPTPSPPASPAAPPEATLAAPPQKPVEPAVIQRPAGDQSSLAGGIPADRQSTAQVAGVPAAPPAEHKAGGVSRLGKQPFALWIGLGVVALAALIGGIWLFGGDGDAPQTPPASLAGQATLETQAAVALLPATSTPEPSPIALPSPTEVFIPSASPTPTLPPTPTIPPGVSFASIKGITLDNQGRYVVEYETFEYTEKLPGVHVHFFFDSVSPEQAGVPGKGPWILYGGPRPFDRYRQADRPAESAQLCALVANADHSVQLNSGNCAVLPDVTAVIPLLDMPCRAGPGDQYAELGRVSTYQARLALGISPDEAWWNVAIPGQPGESCWLPRVDTLIQGDISGLPLVQAPSLPAEAAGALEVEITSITLDAQNRYVVEYLTRGFSEQLPGTHIHFFFDTFQADQVGSAGGGNRLMYGGPSPFTGYKSSDRPAGAARLCALVANPDHSVIVGSGNCYSLP